MFLVVSIFYISAPAALSSALHARISYAGCAHACGDAEMRASSPLVASCAHLAAFVCRLYGLLCAIKANQYN